MFEFRAPDLYINPRASSLWGKNILLEHPYSTVCSSINVTDQVSRSQDTRQIYSTHLIITLLHIRHEDMDAKFLEFNLHLIFLRMQFDSRRYETDGVCC